MGRHRQRDLVVLKGIFEIALADIIDRIGCRHDDVCLDPFDLRRAAGNSVITADCDFKKGSGIGICHCLVLDRSFAIGAFIADDKRRAIILQSLGDDLCS